MPDMIRLSAAYADLANCHAAIARSHAALSDLFRGMAIAPEPAQEVHPPMMPHAAVPQAQHEDGWDPLAEPPMIRYTNALHRQLWGIHPGGKQVRVGCRLMWSLPLGSELTWDDFRSALDQAGYKPNKLTSGANDIVQLFREAGLIKEIGPNRYVLVKRHSQAVFDKTPPGFVHPNLRVRGRGRRPSSPVLLDAAGLVNA